MSKYQELTERAVALAERHSDSDVSCTDKAARLALDTGMMATAMHLALDSLRASVGRDGEDRVSILNGLREISAC